MRDFLLGPGLWENIIGGIVAATLIAIWIRWRERNKHKAIQELIVIMNEAIKHRNIGEGNRFDDAEVWVNQAKAIETKAVETARKISPTAGSLIHSLDRVPPWTNEVELYTSILDVLIERIRGIMERHS
jgi:hypothetical protein